MRSSVGEAAQSVFDAHQEALSVVDEAELILSTSDTVNQLMEYVHQVKGVFEIEKAAERIDEYVLHSPLESSPALSKETSNEVYLKREDCQQIGSFKIRGALNKMLQLTPEEREAGVLAASAGNHAQGVALSAQILGIKATIVMPKTTPEVKVNAVKKLGAEVILAGDNFSQANEYTRELHETSEKTLVPPYDDKDVINGNGTIAKEILKDCPEASHIFIPAGGGGLAAGIAKYVKALHPDVKIILVEPEDSNCVQMALKAGKPVPLSSPPSIFADGVAVNQVGDNPFEELIRYADEVITVSEDDISVEISNHWQETRTTLEGAGALGRAGLKKYVKQTGIKDQKLVALCTGANISAPKLRKALERAEIATGRSALFSVELPEVAGSLREFCKQVVNGHSITQFHYRRNGGDTARALIGFSMKDQADKDAFMSKMSDRSYKYDDLSDDDFAQEHIRHMGGGRHSDGPKEAFYVVDLPERSGALVEFLDALKDRWNISLFQYRSFGSETGRILIGFEEPHQPELEKALSDAGYSHKNIASKATEHFL